MRTILHRLFFALRPTYSARNLITRHSDQLEADSRVAHDHLHLTLGVTEDFDTRPDAELAELRAIGGQIAADPFSLSLDRLVASNRSIALRPGHVRTPLADLGDQLGSRLRRAGLLRRMWRFSPHVTLLYRDGTPFQRPIDAIQWQATDFVLIHSIVGATQHIDCGRWPLVARQTSFAF